MNKKGKSWPLFVVAILIVVFSLTAIFGVSYQYGDTKNIYIKVLRISASVSISAAVSMLPLCPPVMWMPPPNR